MARARTCYDHLAGRLGVALADSLATRGHVILTDEGGTVTGAGRSFLDGIGISLESPGSSRRRALCRTCLDWSERRWHIGGVLGAALANRSFELGWTERLKSGRALAITRKGEQAFHSLFGISI